MHCRKAEECKASGNTCYMSKDYEAAVKLYSEAVGKGLSCDISSFATRATRQISLSYDITFPWSECRMSGNHSLAMNYTLLFPGSVVIV